jgi:hypothetical protein
MRKIDIVLKNSAGSELARESAVVYEHDHGVEDESDKIRQRLIACLQDDGWRLLPGDTLEFVEQD